MTTPAPAAPARTHTPTVAHRVCRVCWDTGSAPLTALCGEQVLGVRTTTPRPLCPLCELVSADCRATGTPRPCGH